jgi:hypothetical protein
VSTNRRHKLKKLPDVERTYTCQQAATILGLSYEKVVALCDSDLLGHRVIHPSSERYTLLMITQAHLDEFVERTNAVKPV